MPLDLTSFDAALKEHYTDRAIENLTYDNNPFFAMVKKFEKFDGDVLPIPVIYGTPQGRSHTFTQAQTAAAATTGKYGKFAVTRVSDHEVVLIDNETIEASSSKDGAFFEAQVTEIDNGMMALTRNVAIEMFRSGFSPKGRVYTSSFATTTLTLGTSTDGQDKSSATNFEIGMQIVFSDTEGGSVLRDSADFLTITGVDVAAGTLTVDANLSNISGIAQNDYIFVRGDRQNAASPSRLGISGLEDWIPQTTPTSTTFFGLNRAPHPTRLGGQRFDGSAVPIDEAIYKGATLAAREGGRPDVCFLNYENYGSLINLLGSKVQYVDVKVADIGFEGVRVVGPAGPIKVIPDQNCPGDRAYVLQLNTWQLATLYKAIRFNNTDGMKLLRQSAADAVEARMVFRGNLTCNAPGWNCNVKLAMS